MKPSLIKMLLSLTIVGTVSAAVLAYVHHITSAPIAAAAEVARARAIAEVLPPFAAIGTAATASGDTKITPAYDAAHEVAGYAVETYSDNAFSGRLSIMVGFDARGAVSGYTILSSSETPGLGAKANEWFKSDNGSRSIIGSHDGSLRLKKDGGDIDGITAATITSRAFLEAVNKARTSLSTYLLSIEQ